jgi:hypothetical protein
VYYRCIYFNQGSHEGPNTNNKKNELLSPFKRNFRHAAALDQYPKVTLENLRYLAL